MDSSSSRSFSKLSKTL